MSSKLWFLKRCDLFERLTAEDLARIEISSRARTFAKKNPVYLPADSAEDVFLVAEGRIKICHLTPDGKQSILAFVEPGELFGELAIFEGGDRDEYAEAVEDSLIVLIPGAAMRRLMEERSELSLGISKMIGLRRRRIERRLKNLLFLSNRDRLTHLLLELAEQYGRTAGDTIELGIRLSHQDLANIVGSTRETVTVVLGEMQAQGLLKVARRKIVIRDINRLAASVHRKAPEVPARKIGETART